VRFRSFFPKCFSLYAIKALAFLLLIELLSAAQNLINFHYNFVDFMVPARFSISLLFGGRAGGELEINLMPGQFSWVAHKQTHTSIFIYYWLKGRRMQEPKTQTQTDIYIYIYIFLYIYTMCVLLLLQNASKKKIKKLACHIFMFVFGTLFLLPFFFPFCLLQLRKIPICSKFCDFSFIRTYKTFLVSCWLFLFLPPQNAIIE